MQQRGFGFRRPVRFEIGFIFVLLEAHSIIRTATVSNTFDSSQSSLSRNCQISLAKYCGTKETVVPYGNNQEKSILRNIYELADRHTIDLIFHTIVITV